MIPERSPDGYANERFFYGVDFVVHVEGSDDVLFWRTVFNCLLPERKFYFREHGGKCEVIAIAKVISEPLLDGVIACMDRDFDQVNGKALSSDRVFYTHGYSWENDVWCAQLIEYVHFQLARINYDGGATRARIASSLSHFEGELRRIVPLDVGLSRFGIRLIAKGRPFTHQGDDRWPRIDRKAIRDRLKRVERPWPRPSAYLAENTVVVTLRDVRGHFFGSFCRQILYALLAENGVKSLAADHLDALAIHGVGERIGTNADLRFHYMSIAAQLQPEG